MGIDKDREQTTFGLSRAKIARLMQIGTEKGQADQGPPVPEDTAELLYEQMIQPLVPDSGSGADASVSPVPADRLATPKATVAIGAALRDRTTAVSALQRLKEMGRRRFSDGKTEPQREVGLTIYYGAIANALMFHNLRITRLSYSELQRSFGELGNRPWMPPDLQALFLEAVRTCQPLHRPRGQPADE